MTSKFREDSERLTSALKEDGEVLRETEPDADGDARATVRQSTRVRLMKDLLRRLAEAVNDADGCLLLLRVADLVEI